jgi:release factor glutamine methyltransferase
MPDKRYNGISASEAVRLMTQAFNAAKTESPAVDARRLVPAALGFSKQDLMREPHRLITGEEAQRLAEFETRRLAHEPVSRILGTREFYGREFAITPATLDPRPDSETLIEAALEIADARGLHEVPIRILDIGTGTGCLLLTLLAELPMATGLGTDISAAALEVAANNSEQLGLQERVRWANARSLEGVVEPFDLIISNPPYIPSADLAGLDPEVRLFDPQSALDGGADGLDIYREIASGLTKLPSFRAVLFEVGAGQAADVEALLMRPDMPKNGYIQTWQDLGGHTRCVALVTH